MVVRIRTGKSLKGAVNYNEHKVKDGKAVLIHAEGYPKEAGQLNFYEKLRRLQALADLNTRTQTNALHVSLNFDPSESLSADTMVAIARDYMEKIGFHQQPYLVYQHCDAAHPHLHIVSTNIQRDGKRISLHNLGKFPSEKARKEIEEKFGLVKAGDPGHRVQQPLSPVDLEKATYGATATKRAISHIVTTVASTYHFTSFAEFNAVLNCWNIQADRGADGSRMHSNGGLQYVILNDQGQKLGVPVKASSLPGKPTLKSLQARFIRNRRHRQQMLPPLREKVKGILEKSRSFTDFASQLREHRMELRPAYNKDGLLFGLHYIDHDSRCVCKGSDLGKECSAAAIRHRWQDTGEPREAERKAIVPAESISLGMPSAARGMDASSSVLAALAKTEWAYEPTPFGLRKKRKRKNRKRRL